MAALVIVLGPFVRRSVHAPVVTERQPAYRFIEPEQAKPSNHQGRLIGRGPCPLLVLLLSMAPTAPAPASPVPIKMMSSLNWSGYAVTGSAFTGVTGTFNVPVPLKSPDCLEETSVWVGVDGANNYDLLQAGVDESTFAVPRSPVNPWQPTNLCTGKVQVDAWWEDLPSAPVRVKLPVNMGDEVTVAIFKMSPGWWALAVHDLTTGHSFMRVQPYGGPQTSVEWVVEAPEVMNIMTNPVPFSTVDFGDLAAQGELRGLDQISFGSKGHYTSGPGALASTAQLMHSGFAVRLAPER